MQYVIGLDAMTSNQRKVWNALSSVGIPMAEIRAITGLNRSQISSVLESFLAQGLAGRAESELNRHSYVYYREL